MSCSNMVGRIDEQSDQTVAVDCVDFFMERKGGENFSTKGAEVL